MQASRACTIHFEELIKGGIFGSQCEGGIPDALEMSSSVRWGNTHIPTGHVYTNNDILLHNIIISATTCKFVAYRLAKCEIRRLANGLTASSSVLYFDLMAELSIILVVTIAMAHVHALTVAAYI